MGKFFRDIYGFDFAYQNLRILRNFNTGELSYLIGRLSGNLVVEGAVYYNRLAHLVELLALLQEIAPSVRELFLHLIIYAVKNRNGLFRSTYHTIVECLGMDNRTYCHLDICRVIYYNRSIAGTHAKRRFAGRIGRLHHAGSSGGKSDIRVLHYHVRKFK